jgi:hypothetical protein
LLDRMDSSTSGIGLMVSVGMGIFEAILERDV